jgi:hypothetical protein
MKKNYHNQVLVIGSHVVRRFVSNYQLPDIQFRRFDLCWKPENIADIEQAPNYTFIREIL